MELVIDAQIIRAYYEETILETDHSATDNPSKIFNRIKRRVDHVSLDNSEQIKQEWRAVINPEWVEVWYARELVSGEFDEIPIKSYQQIKSDLRNLGFPTQGKEGKDYWYIKTAKSVADKVSINSSGRSPLVYIISEDLHMHSPKDKGVARGRARKRILINGRGPIVKYLNRRHRIKVSCVLNYA